MIDHDQTVRMLADHGQCADPECARDADRGRLLCSRCAHASVREGGAE